LLSLHPNIQTKLATEVRDVLKDFNHGQGDRISKKMISKMDFLDAVVKESMRLYPVAPFVVRRIPYDLTIPSEKGTSHSTVTIPQDTFACIWIYGLHRNPKLWHRPDDFLPERWIDPSLQKLDDAQTKFKGTFMPFAFGPRNCVGQPLAQTILRIILARIMNDCEVIDPRVRRLDELFSEGGEEMVKYRLSLRKDMQAGFTVLPSGGVKLVINKRDNKQN
jgi:Cytochrome P450